MPRQAKPKLLCCVCRRHLEVANGRCVTCRNYRWRTGSDRSPDLIEQEIERESRKMMSLASQ
jgi:hypothetical protein